MEKDKTWLVIILNSLCCIALLWFCLNNQHNIEENENNIREIIETSKKDTLNVVKSMNIVQDSTQITINFN